MSKSLLNFNTAIQQIGNIFWVLRVIDLFDVVENWVLCPWTDKSKLETIFLLFDIEIDVWMNEYEAKKITAMK